MRKDSINTNSFQEIENDSEEDHIITNRREEIWVEDSTTLFRKKTVKNVKRYYEPKKRNPSEMVRKSSLLEENETLEEYKLIEIPKEKLRIIRSWNIPTFILKDGGKYFYTHVPVDFDLVGSSKVEHRCAPRTAVCKRLSPLPDCQGGCRKVRDEMKNLERYDWIKTGYETVNTDFECFVVVKCEHQDLEDVKGRGSEVPAKLMLELACNIWNDVDTVDDLIRRIRKNIGY